MPLRFWISISTLLQANLLQIASENLISTIWEPCQKWEELHAIMADTWTAFMCAIKCAEKNEGRSILNETRRASRKYGNVRIVERMRKRGAIFRSLKIVDIKLSRTMFSWYMNRIAWAMLAVEITKQVANVRWNVRTCGERARYSNYFPSRVSFVKKKFFNIREVLWFVSLLSSSKEEKKNYTFLCNSATHWQVSLFTRFEFCELEIRTRIEKCDCICSLNVFKKLLFWIKTFKF